MPLGPAAWENNIPRSPVTWSVSPGGLFPFTFLNVNLKSCEKIFDSVSTFTSFKVKRVQMKSRSRLCNFFFFFLHKWLPRAPLDGGWGLNL